MRAWGYVIFSCGIIFLILFFAALFEGAQIQGMPFIIAICLVLAGSKLIQYGKGIGPTTESRTIKLPMTHEALLAIQQESIRSWRIIRYMVFAYVLLFILIGALIGIFSKQLQVVLLLAYFFGFLGLFVAFMSLMVFWFTKGFYFKKDLKGEHYLRTQGEIKVIPFIGGIILQLEDQSFLIHGKHGIKALSRVKEATIDYTPRTHILLAAWNGKGELIFQAPGYVLMDKTAPLWKQPTSKPTSKSRSKTRS